MKAWAIVNHKNEVSHENMCDQTEVLCIYRTKRIAESRLWYKDERVIRVEVKEIKK